MKSVRVGIRDEEDVPCLSVLLCDDLPCGTALCDDVLCLLCCKEGEEGEM